MKRWIPKIGVIALVVIGGLFWQNLFGEHSSKRTRECEASLMSLYPTGVSISPLNNFILLKRRNATSFELTVRDIRSDKLIAQTTSHNTQLALSWAPDESAIVFLENDDASNQFTLRRWRFKEAATPESLDLATLSAILPIRWAPSGEALLLYQGNGDRGDLTLVQSPLGASPKGTSLGVMLHGGDMRLSPEGTHVAFTKDFNSGEIEIVDVSLGASRKVITIYPGARISSIAWGAQGEILVTARPPNDEFYSLFRANLTTGVISRLLQAPYDLHNPVVDPSSHRFAVEGNRDGRSEILVGEISDAPSVKSLTGIDESVRIIGTSGDRATLYAQGGLMNHSPTVFSMDWLGERRLPAGQAEVVGTSPSFEEIPTVDGHKVPTIVWSGSPKAQDVQRGVIYVHGGPHLQERPMLDGRVLPSMLHATVVAIPNYRGSTGYGASWERREDYSEQALDLAAVITYMKETFRLSGDKITVVSSSTGLRPVFRFLQQAPSAFGTLVLTSLAPPQNDVCKADQFKGAMFGFHGERDPILSPQAARREFLLCSQSAQTREFRVFSHEGHLFHRTSSWAAVFAAVYPR